MRVHLWSRGVAKPSHDPIEIVGDGEWIVEAGKNTHSAPQPPITRVQACMRPAGLAIPAVETAAPDVIPRRDAPVPGELEIDGGTEAMAQNALGQQTIGMGAETGIIDPRQAVAAGKVLGKGAGMIEMTLHAGRGIIEAMGDGLEILLRQRSGGQSPHSIDRTGPARGKRDHLTPEQPSRDTVERLALHVGAEFEDMATEMRRHGDICPQKTAVGMRLEGLGADVRHAKADASHHVDPAIPLRHETGAREHLIDAIAIYEDGGPGTGQLRISSLELLLNHDVGTVPPLDDESKNMAHAAPSPWARGGVRINTKNPTASYARVRVSSTTLAMNSSMPIGTVSLERSRTEMLAASTSFSPRISM